MTNLKLKLKEGDPIEVYDIRDLFIDFRLGTITVNFYTEAGPQTGSYAFSDVDDIDWNVADGTAEQERVLNTYQQRAIRNLPPKLPGQPDYTYEPVMPRVASPTPIKKVAEEQVQKGAEKNTTADMKMDKLNQPEKKTA